MAVMHNDHELRKISRVMHCINCLPFLNGKTTMAVHVVRGVVSLVTFIVTKVKKCYKMKPKLSSLTKDDECHDVYLGLLYNTLGGEGHRHSKYHQLKGAVLA